MYVWMFLLYHIHSFRQFPLFLAHPCAKTRPLTPLNTAVRCEAFVQMCWYNKCRKKFNCGILPASYNVLSSVNECIEYDYKIKLFPFDHLWILRVALTFKKVRKLPYQLNHETQKDVEKNRNRQSPTMFMHFHFIQWNILFLIILLLRFFYQLKSEKAIELLVLFRIANLNYTAAFLRQIRLTIRWLEKFAGMGGTLFRWILITFYHGCQKAPATTFTQQTATMHAYFLVVYNKY